MPALLNTEDVPADVLEAIHRLAAAHNRPPAAEAAEWLIAALKRHEPAPAVAPPAARPGPEPLPDPIPDCLIAPHIIPDFDPPELPGPWERVVPRDVGPLKYEPCCESEEEAPQ